MHLSLAMPSTRQRERVVDEVCGDLLAYVFADIQRISEVDAAPDAHIFVLRGHLREGVVNLLPIDRLIEHEGTRLPGASVLCVGRSKQ
jgi:hypothetical protein